MINQEAATKFHGERVILAKTAGMITAIARSLYAVVG
jgi:hypothetical protein